MHNDVDPQQYGSRDTASSHPRFVCMYQSRTLAENKMRYRAQP